MVVNFVKITFRFIPCGAKRTFPSDNFVHYDGECVHVSLGTAARGPVRSQQFWGPPEQTWTNKQLNTCCTQLLTGHPYLGGNHCECIRTAVVLVFSD